MRERDIFLAAAEIESQHERSAFLQQACGDDTVLRRRIEELIAIGEQENQILDSLPLEFAARHGAESLEEAPGTLIGRYKLLEAIGEGGFALVYMAEQTEPVRRRVALKIIKAGMDTRQVVARFEAERQALALMDHPNIAKVFDGGMTPAGRPYFVMELVGGTPITEFCDAERLITVERLGIFLQVCRAVQHAHQKGIIHRDLKPSNILVAIHDDAPVPKVIDFGIAKATQQPLTDKTLFTRFHQFIGTPAYMSPEQATLGGVDIDTRTDVYSLGAILYELLVGVTPLGRQLEKAAYDEVSRVLRDEQPSLPSARISTLAEKLQTVSKNRRIEPHELRRLVRGDLDWIIMKALEKDRNRRYETASGLARDIERFLRKEPVSAFPPSPWYRLRKFVRRNRWPIFTSILIGSSLLAGIGVSVSARNEAVRERDHANQQLFAARRSHARAARWSRRSGQRFESLAALAEAAQLARDLDQGDGVLLELRNEAIACLALVDMKTSGKSLEHVPQTGFIVFDPGLQRFARSCASKRVDICNVRDGRTIFKLTGPKDVDFYGNHLRFCRKGEFLAVCCHTRGALSLEVWHVGRKERVLADVPFYYSHRNGSFDFAPDGQHLAVIEPGGTVGLYSIVEGSRVKELVAAAAPPPSGVAFNCDGSRFALGRGPKIQVFDASTGGQMRHLDQPDGTWFLAWHPRDPNLLAASRFSIHLWDVSTGEQLVLRGHTAEIVDLAFSQQGDMLASRGWDNSISIWNPWTGQELVSSSGTYIHCYLQFGADSRQLAFASRHDRFGLIDVEPPGVFRSLDGLTGQGQGTIGTCDISPNGRLLVAGLSHGPRDGLSLWDLPTGQRVAAWRTSGSTHGAVFDRLGNGIFSGGDAGLHYWPIDQVPGQPDKILIGKPQAIGPPGSFHRIALSNDGRRLAAVRNDRPEAVLVELPRQVSQPPHHPAEALDPPGAEPETGTSSLRMISLPHPGVVNLALSRDGRFVATGTWHGNEVRVWDAPSGELLQELPGRSAIVAFSPDSRWLATSTGQELCLYQVGSWQLHGRRQRDHFGDMALNVAFSPDSRLLAAAADRTQVELIDPEKRRLLAVLESPDAYGGTILRFAPDGTQLVVGLPEVRALHVWNLKLLRQNLAKLGLDYGQPPYPTEPAATN